MRTTTWMTKVWTWTRIREENLTIQNVVLRMPDKVVLLHNEHDDKVISAAQKLICYKFPSLNGLQPMLVLNHIGAWVMLILAQTQLALSAVSLVRWKCMTHCIIRLMLLLRIIKLEENCLQALLHCTKSTEVTRSQRPWFIWSSICYRFSIWKQYFEVWSKQDAPSSLCMLWNIAILCSRICKFKNRL